MKTIIYYKTKNGKCPYFDWYKTLDKSVQYRIGSRLERVEDDNFGDYKKIDNELSELRLKFGSGYRIYFYEYQNIIVVLLTAGDKSTQSKDIKKAKEYLEDLKERYKYD